MVTQYGHAGIKLRTIGHHRLLSTGHRMFGRTLFFLASLRAYLDDGIFSDAFQFQEIYRSAMSIWPKLAISVIAFWGIFYSHSSLRAISIYWNLGTDRPLDSLAFFQIVH